ncbi:MAG: DUF4174 domain-containing protein [Planctomycetota bacterium]
MTIGMSHSDQVSTIEDMLLYVFSPSRQERRYQIQMDTLTDRQLALDDHHVTVAEVFEHEDGQAGTEVIRIKNSTGLRREYHISPGQFKVVLVGKDSAIKLCSESCVSCEEVFMRVENENPEEVETISWR